MNLCQYKECTGCTACSAICPVKAISIICDERGFARPLINEKKCIQCGQCEKLVTNLQNHMKTQVYMKKPIECFAVKLKNEKNRMSSQSGGAFYGIAKLFLINKGIVYGCSYDSQLVVKHIRVDKIEELHYLQGSKYVQSEMGNCIYSIESDLKNNKKVLFSGTPCQCAGVIEFAISKKLNIDNLYTCDFICHGVPSPRIYRDYLKFKEDKLGKKIAMVNLRDKSAGGWRKHVDSITYSDGSTEVETTYVDLFYSNLALRESCETCKYTNINRPSDITVADCWGIEKIDPNLWNDNKGISMILIQTNKGKQLLEEVLEKDLFDVKSFKIGDLIQPQMTHSSKVPYQKSNFWKDYGNISYENLLKKYTEYGGITFKIKRKILKMIGKW